MTDWMSKIDEKYFYPNKGFFESKGQAVPDSVEGLPSYQKCVKLAGLRELAFEAGVVSCDYTSVTNRDGYVAVRCALSFREGAEHGLVSWTDMANATAENSGDFMLPFLETLACNRSFARAVRASLNIDVVSDVELSSVTKSSESESKVISRNVLERLKNKSKELGDKNFVDFKKRLFSMHKDTACKWKWKGEKVEWKTWGDIPKYECAKIFSALDVI